MTNWSPLLLLCQFGQVGKFDQWLRCAIDIMHSEGNVAKHSIELLIDTLLKGQTKAKDTINTATINILRPDSSLQTKSLESPFWKTFDYHQWLLVLLLPTVLTGVAASNTTGVRNFLNIMAFYIIAMRIFLNSHTASHPSYLRLAGKLMAYYVKNGPSVFGQGFRGITQHQVCTRLLTILNKVHSYDTCLMYTESLLVFVCNCVHIIYMLII